MSCYLVLDFDGVFRGSEAHSETNFAALSSFEAVLREFPEVELVVTSSRARSLIALRELFSVDLAQRVVGVTHDMPPPMGGNDHGICHQEAIEWLALNGEPDRPRIGLDVEPRLFERSAPVVFASHGFGPEEAFVLRIALTDPAAYAHACRLCPMFPDSDVPLGRWRLGLTGVSSG